MSDQTTLLRSVETKVTRRAMGNSYLEVHEKFAYGEKIMDAFTLASLADVLELPMSTMEGRYARAKLHRWKVDIPSRSGRPQRGFPMALLEEVIVLIQTPGASVQATADGDTVKQAPRASGVAPLVPTYFGGQAYFTLTALADHFGVSNTTIRNKLRKAGLSKRLVNLGSSMHGGRPRRAMPESALGDVKLAIIEGARFATELDRILANTGRARDLARADMQAAIAPHTPPSRGSLRAWDSATLAPVVPLQPARSLNSVKSWDSMTDATVARAGFDSQRAAEELAVELENIFADLGKPAAPVEPPPAVASSDDPHVIARQAWQFQLHGLSTAKAEPTDEELRDTCDMMDLDSAAAERFVGEVKAARAALRGAA